MAEYLIFVSLGSTTAAVVAALITSIYFCRQEKKFEARSQLDSAKYMRNYPRSDSECGTVPKLQILLEDEIDAQYYAGINLDDCAKEKGADMNQSWCFPTPKGS